MYRKHVGRALILALMLSGATSMNAQRITRQFKNVPLKTVLAEVEKELQYSIIYKKDEVNERKQITRDFKDASLEEVLSAVLDNGLSYSVQGKKIVISKKEAAGSSITQQKQIIVKGIVKDENGEPVVGANVVEKGTSNGTITDMDGNFSLSISEGSKLSITYIGYLDKDVAVSKGKTTLNIQLKEDTQALDEVVVVGYGSVKKRDLTGSVSQISSSSIQNQAVMSGEKYADWKRMANYGKTDKEIFDDIQLKTLNSGQFVDWQDLMFSGTGYKTDHNVSINQSNGRNRNMLVLGYNKDQSIIDNMGYERFSARINGDMELAKNLTVGYSSLLALTTRNNGDNSVWKYGTVIDPLTEVYDENGDMRFYNSGWYQTVLHSNPLFDTDKNNVDNKEKRTRILLNLFADWEIIKGLKFRTSLTYGLSSIENGVYKSSTSQARQLASPSAEYKKTNEQQITFTNVLNYKKVLNDHSLDVSLVHDMQTDKAELVGLTGQDMPYYGSWFNVNEAPDVFTRLSSVRKWALLSFMGRVNYTFKDRYLLTLTGRYDGSSRLAKGNKWDFFPSVALAWRMNDESFLREVDWLSNLKLRLSWGNSGNTAISEYATQGALGKYVYYFGTTEQSAMGYLPTELANNQLGWESTEEYNVGVDFGFLNNRISGSIDGYIRNTRDLLMKRNLPINTGYEFTWQNVGKTRNSGIEIALNTVPVVTKDFRWTVDLTFGYNKNEIVELFNGKEDSPGNKWFIGQPLYVERLYKYIGVWQYGEKEEAAKYGREPGNPKIEDVNNNGVYDEGDLHTFNKIPKWTAGLSTGFYYKNFDLNVYFYTRQKYGQLLGVLTDEAGSTRYNHLDVDFWTPDNPSNACPKPAITNPQELLVSSDYAYRDLSFIRLKNINLGYTLPKEISKKFYSEKFRVYFMVENPYTWTKSDYVGLDPENCNSYTDHRPLTSFIFGVNASF